MLHFLDGVRKDNQEIFSLEELVKEFDYHNMSKSPAVFDYSEIKMDEWRIFEGYGF